MARADLILRGDVYIHDSLVASILTRTENAILRHNPGTKAEFNQMMSRSLRMDADQAKLVLALLETSGKARYFGRGHSCIRFTGIGGETNGQMH